MVGKTRNVENIFLCLNIIVFIIILFYLIELNKKFVQIQRIVPYAHIFIWKDAMA